MRKRRNWHMERIRDSHAHVANRKNFVTNEGSVSPAGFDPATSPPRTERSPKLSYGLTEPS